MVLAGASCYSYPLAGQIVLQRGRCGMGRFAALISLFSLLAGCIGSGDYGASGPRSPQDAVPPGLDWHTAITGDVVTVELTDHQGYYRIERVALLGPNGETVGANELTRETVRRDADAYDHRGVDVGIGAHGGSRGGHVGLGFSFPLNGPSRSPAISLTYARIRIPDAEAYRRTAGRWKIEIFVTDPAGASGIARIPAPRPAD